MKRPKDIFELVLAFAIVGSLWYFSNDLTRFVIRKLHAEAYPLAYTVIDYSILLLSFFGFLIAKNANTIHTVRIMIVQTAIIFILAELLQVIIR
ncbi:hypothetical protein [Spirosoma koreense]